MTSLTVTSRYPKRVPFLKEVKMGKTYMNLCLLGLLTVARYSTETNFSTHHGRVVADCAVSFVDAKPGFHIIYFMII
jgi:hypothetical protein